MTPEDQNQPQSFGPQPDVSQVPQAPLGSPDQPTTTPTDPTAQPDVANSQTPTVSNPAPYQPVTPATPNQPQAFGVGTPAGTYATAPATQPSSSSNKGKLIIGIVSAVIAVAFLAGGFMLFKMSQAIKLNDVTAAQHTSDALADDINDVSTAMNSVSFTDLDGVDDSIQTIRTKLTDAEKQYDALKKSPVQRDKDVKEKFTAMDNKWTPFVTYIRDNAADTENFAPVIADFEEKITALTSKPPKSTAELATYLTSYKALVDDTNTKINSVSIKITENKQIIDALKKYLTTSSSSVQAAQSSLAAGNLTSTNTELLKARQSELTFTSAVSDAEEAISKKQDALNPADQFHAFEKQLDTLANKVK